MPRNLERVVFPLHIHVHVIVICLFCKAVVWDGGISFCDPKLASSFYIEMFVNGLSFKFLQRIQRVSLKNMAARGRGHFSILDGYFLNLPIFSISLPQLLQTASYSHQVHKGYILTKGHNSIMYFDKITSL